MSWLISLQVIMVHRSASLRSRQGGHFFGIDSENVVGYASGNASTRTHE